ncbi:MAG: hypothetical protein ACOCR6_03550 [archaeon]
MVSLIRHRISQYRLTSFFILAYALSWTLDAIPKLLEMNPSWG